jgi:hypothetical protein
MISIAPIRRAWMWVLMWSSVGRLTMEVGSGLLTYLVTYLVRPSEWHIERLYELSRWGEIVDCKVLHTDHLAWIVRSDIVVPQVDGSKSQKGAEEIPFGKDHWCCYVRAVCYRDVIGKCVFDERWRDHIIVSLWEGQGCRHGCNCVGWALVWSARPTGAYAYVLPVEAGIQIAWRTLLTFRSQTPREWKEKTVENGKFFRNRIRPLPKESQ